MTNKLKSYFDMFKILGTDKYQYLSINDKHKFHYVLCRLFSYTNADISVFLTHSLLPKDLAIDLIHEICDEYGVNNIFEVKKFITPNRKKLSNNIKDMLYTLYDLDSNSLKDFEIKYPNEFKKCLDISTEIVKKMEKSRL